MKTKTIIYFAYGANLNRDGMDARCPGNMPLCHAVLNNYRLMFKGVADIEDAVNHSVHGVLYEITPKHLRSLDRFEGYPKLYIRKTVPVFTDNDTEINAVAYRMTDNRQYASPHHGYLDIILSGCYQWQLPQEYIRYIITRAQNPGTGEL